MKRVVVIGDSITAAQHLEPGEAGWTMLLRGYEVFMAGVPGDTTRLGLERFPSAVQVRMPDAVVIQFGHNDANRWQTDRGLPRVSEAAYVANLAEMAQRVRQFGGEPFLCTLTPVGPGRGLMFADDVYRYDCLLRKVARDTEARLVDVRSAFCDQRHLLMADGLHLTAEGHEVYAGVVQRALDEWAA